MSRGKKHTAEQIINKLREAEIAISEGQTTVTSAKKIGITYQSYYRWRQKYGGMAHESKYFLYAAQRTVTTSTHYC